MDDGQQSDGRSRSKRELIARLLKQKGIAAAASTPIPVRASRGPAPLSYAQARLWFLDQLEPGNTAYNMPGGLRLRGRLHAATLERSIGEVVARHEALRTTFEALDGQPLQRIHDTLDVTVTHVDLRAVPKADREAHVRDLARDEVSRPFDLATGPLVRAQLLELAEDDHVVLFTMHHIVSDGWSMSVLIQEITALYAAFLHGNVSPLEPLPLQFADYATWQREWLVGDELGKQLGYWKAQLERMPHVLELPTDRPRPAVQTFRGAVVVRHLRSELKRAVQEIGRKAGATEFMTLLSAFGALASRYSGQEELVIGTPIANRRRKETEGLIGLFVNTLALPLHVADDATFEALLHGVKEMTLGAYAHQDLPFEKLVDALKVERDLGRSPLFQVMFILQNTPGRALALEGLRTDALEEPSDVAKFDLTLEVAEAGEGYELRWDYNRDLFERETIERMAGHFDVLLRAALARPDTLVARLPLMTDAELLQIRETWNHTDAPFTKGTLHGFFEAQAKRTPDAPALVDGARRISYAELDARANAIAARLIAAGIGPESLVAVMLDRSAELVIALLAVLKAGAAYVPIDPAYPRERVGFVLEDSQAQVVLSQPSHAERLEEPFRARAMFITDERAAQPSRRSLAWEQRAYVIYTSGSTGRPKGVEITHRSATVFVEWALRTFSSTELRGVLAATSVCFDLSIFEIFVTLAAGGKVILAENALALPTLAAKDEVTLVNTVPSVAAELVRSEGIPSSVEVVNLAGEALPANTVARLYALPHVEKVYNLYGPSEDTTYSTFVLASRGGWRPTIGRPIDNTRAYVLDSRLEPVPIGVRGEIYLAGAGLARGYLHRPALTADRFVPNPFGDAWGGRLYRTGDVGRVLPDGQIEYVGRADFQVKIRGFRIELGEIESLLGSEPSVREAIVLAREDRPGDKRLVAYLTARTESGVDPDALRSFLAKTLPDYMIPTAFVVLDRIPVTPNGKVDRRALPEPDLSSTDEHVAPRNVVETELAAIWKELLHVDQVGIHDNFFHLGGHSLLATQVVSRVRSRLGRQLRVAALFESPTVAALASALAREPGGEAPMERIPRASRDRPLTTSFSQWRLWFMDQLAPGSPVYNMFQALRVSGAPDVAALADSFNALVIRHEVLRTTFASVNGEPQQVVAPQLTLELPVISLEALEPEAREARARELANAEVLRPFDLANGPLLRVTLVKLGEHEHLLLMCMHHIIGDAWSLGVLLRELAVHYRARLRGETASLPELPIQYADFAAWQRQWFVGDVRDAQIDYWRRTLAGLPTLDLPTDRPRPPTMSFRGALRSFELPKELSRSLRALTEREGHTLFITLLAGFASTVGRIAGSEDFAVGTPVANRTRVELEGLIGFFVNTLVLRMNLAGNPSYREVTARVRKVALEAYDHQDLSFEKLVEVVQPKRDLSRGPLRQVAFALQDARLGAAQLDGLTLTPIEPESIPAKLDLMLNMWEDGDQLRGAVEYATDLFDPGTIDRFCASFSRVLEDMVEDFESPVLSLPPLVDLVAAPTDSHEQVLQATNLAENQLLIWFSKKLYTETPLYFHQIVTTFGIEGDVSPLCFQRAFQRLVDEADVLRTFIREVDGVPRRTVVERLPYAVEVHDFSGAPDADARAQAWVDARSNASFDIEQGLFECALLRVGPTRSIWFLSLSHLISDSWSIALMCRIMSDYYRRAVDGTLAQAPSLPKYETYLEHERSFRGSRLHRKAEAYWQKKLATRPNLTEFYASGQTQSTTLTRRLSVELGEQRSRLVKTMASQGGFFSPGIVFSTALWAYLYRVSGEGLIRVGSPFANRPEAFKDTLGLFMHACPMQVAVGPEDTFTSLGKRVQTETLQTAFQQAYAVRNPLYDKTFNVYFNYQNATFSDFAGMPVRTEWFHNGHSNDTMTLQVTDMSGTTNFRLDFDLNCVAFDAAHAERTVGHYLGMLDALLADPSQPLSTPPMLSAEELARLDTFNATAVPYAHDVCLHTLIEAQVARSPDAVALVFEGQALTYAELNGRANQLAHHLQRLGVGRDVRVGVCVERSLELVVALLGILKAGGAYVPLDPAYPASRLAFMMEDAELPVLLTQQRLAEIPCGEQTKRIFLDTQWDDISVERSDDLEALTDADSIAYVIYTSGSTGKPKGAMVPHRGIVNRLLWMQDEYRLDRADRILQKTPFSFDVSVWEFFWPLMTGATLVVARPGGHQDPGYLVDILERERITTLHFVPSMLRAFLDEPGLERCTSVKRVICSGEALTRDLQDRFFTRLGHSELHNLYGPTEASVDVSYWACRPEQDRNVVPIGRPVANTQLHVLDAHLNRVPEGLAGELHIGGVQLARGYLRRPELTAEKFITDPYSPEPNARLYKTGDLARFWPDGNLEFLGRIDHQVKLRGLRIELGEIESVLGQHPSVEQAVVMARERRAADVQIVAYVVPKAPHVLEPRVLSGFLLQQLPDYMVPASFVALASMPLGPSGKVDRKQLSAQESTVEEPEAPYVAPRSDVETLLAETMEQLLGVPRVGIHDDFFRLGGHSLLAAQLVSRIHHKLGRRLQLSVLFQAPSVAALSQILSADEAPTQSGQILVPIRKQGSRPPLFCLHPAGGQVLVYKALAAQIDPEQPVYALQSRALEDPDTELPSLAAMAERYAEIIRQVQPQGPYHLLGWSMGGVLAVSIARLLEDAGQAVAFVGLVDSFPRGVDSSPSDAEADPLTSLALVFGGALSDAFLSLTPGEQQALREQLAPLGPQARVEHAIAWARERNLLPPTFGLDVLRAQVALMDLHGRLLAAHTPPVIEAAIDVWWARDNDLPRPDWSRYTHGAVKTELAEGDHFTVLRGAHSGILHQQLATRLRERSLA